MDFLKINNKCCSLKAIELKLFENFLGCRKFQFQNKFRFQNEFIKRPRDAMKKDFNFKLRKIYARKENGIKQNHDLSSLHVRFNPFLWLAKFHDPFFNVYLHFITFNKTS